MLFIIFTNINRVVFLNNQTAFYSSLFKILQNCYIFSKSFYKLRRDTMYLNYNLYIKHIIKDEFMSNQTFKNKILDNFKLSKTFYLCLIPLKIESLQYTIIYKKKGNIIAYTLIQDICKFLSSNRDNFLNAIKYHRRP